MQMMNGTTEPKINPLDLNGLQEQPGKAARKNRPAKDFTDGDVVTRIWANRNDWDEVSWKIDQVRINHYSAGRRTRSGLYFDHLQDAMRGLYKAKRWISRAERRRRGSWFWWW